MQAHSIIHLFLRVYVVLRFANHFQSCFIMMPSLFIYAVLLYSFSYHTHALTLLLRQYQDGSYDTCAQACFEPLVNASSCPFDTSGTRNACLCSSNTFLTNFMTCTFKDCGGEVLAQTAKTAVNNCALTSTPSVLNADQLVSIGQGIGSTSTTTVASSTGKCRYTPYLIPI
jgi:hypothetical protein